MLTGKTIDRDGQQKLYVQIYSIIKENIEKGHWPVGSRILTEDELCRTYDVSKATIRIAISELDREGYVRREQGRGTFVTYSRPQMGMDMRTRLTENMFGEGVKARREILVKGVKEPCSDVKSYLQVEKDIYYVLCKRVVEDRPACLEECFFPLYLFPGIEGEDISQSSLFSVVQGANLKVSRVLQTIEVTEINGDEAKILKVERGSSALLMHRLLIGQNGNPLAYTRLFGSGRTYKIRTEFERLK